ncbi:MAG: DUF4190 domain-containing protein [Clostridium sp.]|nr:DUF4190 domain-containing protein [Clostridium sp.]
MRAATARSKIVAQNQLLVALLTIWGAAILLVASGGSKTRSTVRPPDSADSSEPPAEVALPRNGFALTGLVLGIASIFLSFVGIIPILAIIFSGIGLAKVKDRGGRGKVQAWVGLILGVLYTLVNMYLYGHLG